MKWFDLFLATGLHFTAMEQSFRMGSSTMASIVKKTCVCLRNMLQSIEMERRNREKWIKLADQIFNVAAMQYFNTITFLSWY